MKNHDTQVLVIEDNPGDVRLIQEMLLEVKDKSFNVELAENLSKALERLKQGGVDVVMSDLGLPDSQGLATFEQLHTHSPEVPIVILTSTYDDETTAVEAVSKGAQDYLVKGQVDGKVVSRVLRYAVERMRVEEELRKGRDRAQKYLDVAGVIMVAIGADQKITLMNKKGYEVLGYKEEELIGRNWFDTVLPIGTRDKVKDVFDRLITGENEPAEYFENSVLTKNSQELLIAWHNAILKDEKGNIIGTLSSGEDITQRKQAEEKLNESEAKNRALLAAIPDLMFRLTKDGTFVDYRGAGNELLMPPEKFLGRKVHEVLPKAIAEQTIQSIEQALQTGETQLFEYSLPIGDDVRHYETRLVVSGEDEVLSIVRDITQHKQAVEELKESEERFQSLFKSVNEVVWAALPDGSKYLYVNDAIERVYGRPATEFLENANIWQEAIHPDDISRVLKESQELLERGNIETQYRIVRPDGEIRWINDRKSAVYDEDGKPIRIGGIAIDITEHKIAEHLRQENEEQSHRLVESIQDGIIMVDQNLQVRVMNPAAFSIMNLVNSDSFPDVKTVEKALDVDFHKLEKQPTKDHQDIVRKEVVIRSHMYAILVFPLRSGEGKFDGFVVSMRDITEEKRLEELKSEFVSVVSHELRTPLTCIKNAVDLLLLKKAGEINENQSNFLSMASRNVDRLVRIINDFLDISKMEAGKMQLRFERIDLAEIAEGTLSTFALPAQKKSMKLEKSISSGIPKILGDHDKLSQVLSNLVSNAVKYGPEGGKICIQATLINKTKSPLPQMLFLTHDDFVKVEVKDNGPGIPGHETEKIFDKFYQVERSLTRNISGTGLGLPICKKLVEAHKGKIWVESKTNQGSNFVFVLPLLQEQEIFDCHLENLVNQAKLSSSFLSLALLQVKDFEAIKVAMGAKRANEITEDTMTLAQKTLWKSGDYVHPDHESGRLFIILGDTSKEGALAVCRRLKENLLNHNFSIEGKSTEVEFFLGLANYPDDANTTTELREVAERTDHFSSITVRKKTILVIDDDQNFAHALSRKFIRRGYGVLEAFSGIEGIEKAKQVEPDLIILDIKMQGMDGYEVTSRLKQEDDTKHIPILAISGSINTNVEKILALGAGEFITKPFSDTVLMSAVERLIEMKEEKHVYHTGGGR
ncbi:MAG: PAS domain S-box protein [Candidatus Zixiibacteriota bacterium]